VVLGRGIERAGRTQCWRPTRYIEKPNGWRHTGLRHQDTHMNDEDSIVAGSNANTLAAVDLTCKLMRAKHSAKLVVFAAGRPPYLAVEQADISEGSIMAAAFKRRIGLCVTNPPAVIILDQNKNTQEDIEMGLMKVRDNGLTSAAIVTVAVHLPRVQEFCKQAQREFSQLKQLKVDFVCSEDVLASRHRLYRRLFNAVWSSRAFHRTQVMEENGLRALREGRYKLEFR
jgi:hypothetical protein